MRVEDKERLLHMLDSAKEAILYVSGRARSDLENNRMLAMALVKEIEIIGEAANNITVATRVELSEIPWQNIIGMRHRLVHAYFEIDHEILWDTVTQNIPPLITALEDILGSGR